MQINVSANFNGNRRIGHLIDCLYNCLLAHGKRETAVYPLLKLNSRERLTARQSSLYCFEYYSISL